MLLKQFGLVKGVGFNSWRRVGSVLPAIRVYNQRDVDELILVDVLGHKFGVNIDCELIQEYGSECFVPLTVGGGVKSVDQVQELLAAGADKVCLNTIFFELPELVGKIAKKFGSQCVVASVDVRNISHRKWECFSHAGQIPTGRDVVDWVKELEDRGAGEILLTSIERDGTMEGYDIDLLATVSEAVKLPVIASGGAGSYQHFVDAVLEGGASAVAAASIFHFTEKTPAEAKAWMANAGIPVRQDFKVVPST